MKLSNNWYSDMPFNVIDPFTMEYYSAIKGRNSWYLCSNSYINLKTLCWVKVAGDTVGSCHMTPFIWSILSKDNYRARKSISGCWELSVGTVISSNWVSKDLTCEGDENVLKQIYGDSCTTW